MADDTVNITYETLFDILRAEKQREELQKLDENFFKNLVEYLKDKQQIMLKVDDTLFSAGEKEKTKRQLQNINKMLKEFYERREKKIINMAINRSRTNSSIIDTSTLLAEEKQFYESILKILDLYRKGILLNILESKAPEIQQEQTGEQENLPKQPCDNKLIRFLQPVPKFVGQDLEIYGPFEKEDIANLPKRIADILILKERAAEIKQE
ncbi:hypothetical protein KY330_00255 [Candidatus Woesearchaeota archaeon]|nr:hypothetical protein [Candidatus Woesearchaeota archaeon]